MRPTWILLAGTLLSACSPEGSDPQPGWDGSIQVFGTLHAVVAEGHIGPEVALSSLLPDPRLVALGAASGLKGEITILEGQAWRSRVDAPENVVTEVDPTTTETATLLVSAQVSRWNEVRILRRVAQEEIDDVIATAAHAQGISTDRAFPFVVVGQVSDLEAHVIDGTRLAKGPSSHEEHRRASFVFALAKAEARLVGFHSTRHAGVFVHHDAQSHLHVLLEDPRRTGHVDRVTLEPGTILRLPAFSDGPR